MSRADLRSLRYFVAVAEAGSVGKAALNLHMAQPPLSVQIRNLETHLGIPLFRRVAGGMLLTDAGHALLVRARGALALADDGFEAARAVGSGRRGRLTVGYMFALGYSVLPQLVPRLREGMPGVELQFVEISATNYEAMVSELRVTVALCMPPILRDGVSNSIVGLQPLCVAMAVDSPLSALDVIPLKTLEGASLISLPGPAEGMDHSVVATLLRREQILMHITHRVETIHAAFAMIMAGEGIAILPSCAAHGSPPGVTFRPLSGVADRFDVAVAWRSDLDNPLISPFIEAVRSSLPAEWQNPEMERSTQRGIPSRGPAMMMNIPSRLTAAPTQSVAVGCTLSTPQSHNSATPMYTPPYAA
ncbi:LysR substrate-binding domain-containing protein [soil metagenome]